MRDELRRLFPTIRPRTTNSFTPAIDRRQRRRTVVSKTKPFMKEVLLLKNHLARRTLTGFNKADAYDKGLFDVLF